MPYILIQGIQDEGYANAKAEHEVVVTDICIQSNHQLSQKTTNKNYYYTISKLSLMKYIKINIKIFQLKYMLIILRIQIQYL